MKSENFKDEISRLLKEAIKQGLPFIDIISGDVHRNVGGYPSKNHSMPVCCDVMYSMKRFEDVVLHSPIKGKGATLKLRYYLSLLI